jgi:hypothetical protein
MLVKHKTATKALFLHFKCDVGLSLMFIYNTSISFLTIWYQHYFDRCNKLFLKAPSSFIVNTVQLVQSDTLWYPTKIYGPKVFLLSEIKPEYSDILYNPTYFPVPLVCRIRQVISLFPWCVWLDRLFPCSLGVSD